MSQRDFRNSISPQDTKALANASLAVVMVVIAVFILFRSWYTVLPNEQAVVMRFGKYHATSIPGLHFCIPLVDQILKVSVEEHRLRLPLGSAAERRYVRHSESDELLILTGDLNAVSVEWTVLWQVQNAREYLFSFFQQGNEGYVEEVISTVANTVMNRLVGDYSIYEVLTEKRSDISHQAQKATQAILDQYKCGVVITELSMQRARPPERVTPAFAKVNSAVQVRDRLENEANKERNTLLPRARAERDRMTREAEGYASRRMAEVNGEIAALRARYRAYIRSPEITRKRMYLETMERVLSGIPNKTIIDADLQHILPLLQLDRGAGQ